MTQGLFTAVLLAFSSVSIPQVDPPRVNPQQSSLRASENHIVVLYYTTYCPYSQKVLKYLQKIHKQLPMRNLQDDPQAKAELKEIGGKLQVPCLVVDGQTIYESDAIIEWLSQHQDELEPADTQATW